MADRGPGDVAAEIDRMMKEMGGPISQGVLHAIGAQAINIITLRTKSGRDMNLNPFTPYSKEYQKKRAELGRSSSTVDLAVTGHMQGAITQSIGTGETTLRFMDANANRIARAHNDGVDSLVSVRPHRRSTYVNTKTGQRVNAKEVARDRKRKNKRVSSRMESVGTFERHQREPKREFFGIAHPNEQAVIQETAYEAIKNRFEKK